MPKSKLNYKDLFDRVQSVMKTRQDNNMIDRTDVVYAKNEIDLSWLVRLGAVYNENQIGQCREWSYKCGPNWNEIKMSWTITLGIVYDENQTRQQCDQSYRCSLRQK